MNIQRESGQTNLLPSISPHSGCYTHACTRTLTHKCANTRTPLYVHSYTHTSRCTHTHATSHTHTLTHATSHTLKTFFTRQLQSFSSQNVFRRATEKLQREVKWQESDGSPGQCAPQQLQAVITTDLHR